MNQQTQVARQKTPFVLNKTKVNQLGFNLSSDEKLYEQLTCPFQQDTTKAHPLNAKYPQNFYSFEFNFDKVSSRLNQQTMFYIFYNVMDQRLQMYAGRALMKNKYKYNKQLKVWIRKVQGRFQYFSIVQWKHLQYNGPKGGDFICTQAEFAQK